MDNAQTRQISIRQVIQLRWEQVEQEGPPTEIVSFEVAASTHQQVRAWLWWSHTNLRPRIVEHSQCGIEFVSAYTGKPFSESSIQEHFKQGVTHAMMNRSIPGVAAFQGGIARGTRELWRARVGKR